MTSLELLRGLKRRREARRLADHNRRIAEFLSAYQPSEPVYLSVTVATRKEKPEVPA